MVEMPSRKPNYEIVVSAENNPYIAWQAMLFHYSCLKQTGRAPLVVVHGDTTQRLVVGFQTLRRHGGRIQRAPNFRLYHGIDYVPRNTPGTLRCVESEADYLVLCDADMIFLGPARFGRHRLAEDQISLDRLSYMAVNRESRPYLAPACKRAGVSLRRLARDDFGGGVPHIVPVSLQSALSREWLRSIEFFFPNCPAARAGNSSRRRPKLFWIASMWALILAIHRLGLRPIMTQFAVTNFGGDRVAPPPSGDDLFLIHYGYGDSVFDKRKFFGEPGTCDQVWQVRLESTTLSGRICKEIAEARAFFGL
jgi:hypothetical protein